MSGGTDAGGIWCRGLGFVSRNIFDDEDAFVAGPDDSFDSVDVFDEVTLTTGIYK
jgi:hypothetical protein